MNRPPSPQYGETEQGWAWSWEVPEGLPDPRTGHQARREVQLEWLLNARRWQVRSAVDTGGWSPPLPADLDAPETFDHADQLAREFASRPRGGTTHAS